MSRKRTPTVVAILVALLAGAAATSVAQESSIQTDAFNEWLEAKQAGDTTESFAPQLPSRTTLDVLAEVDSTTAAKYLDALRAQYDYKVRGFDHRSRVFEWQFYSSIVIFAVVICLVLAGLYFSWLQFRRDLAAPPGSEAADTQLAVSTEGIKVQSSILGVIILVISLLFFYLYLVYVYPIREIL